MKTWLEGSLALALCLLACGEREFVPVHPRVLLTPVIGVQTDAVEEVDLLFVIDNSGSMGQEQGLLAAEIPRIVYRLASGDVDGDGTPEVRPVDSLHVGVVSTDMGTGDHMLATCDLGTGDDGVLRTTSNRFREGCAEAYPTFLEFVPDGADPDEFAAEVGCVAGMGTDGCSVEQPLEASLKAVTRDDSPIAFLSGRGHGDVANDGFLRPNSLLVVWMLTDEDDCSVRDPELLDLDSERYTGDFNLRCPFYPDALQPVERWVDGLLAVRPDASRLFFAAVAGVPERANPDLSFAIDWDALLAHPDMQQVIDPGMTTRLRPSCDRPGTGLAFPPLRIVEAARALEARGAGAVVQSICAEDYSDAVEHILSRISHALVSTCLARPVNVGSDGLVACEVTETLPSDGPVTRCSQLTGWTRVRTQVGYDGTSREVCRVQQLRLDEPGDGWFYEGSDMPAPGSDLLFACPSTRPQRVQFRSSDGGGRSVHGGWVQVQCLARVVEGPPGEVNVGSPCTDGCETVSARAEVTDRWPGGLACEPETQTCQPVCETTAMCAVGYVCSVGHCVNPTCL